LNEAVSKDLTAAFNAIEQNPSVRGVVLISGKPNVISVILIIYTKFYRILLPVQTFEC